MCLGHVYIVLEPVGSARLTFRRQLYYEFICFDVPKVVRSLGCDHGHDKESRNGRDINIDILEAYIWISESFRVKSGSYRSTGGLPEPPRGFIGPTWALREKREGGRRWPRAPPLPSPNRTREGGRRPAFLPLFLLFPPSPIPNRKEGSPTPGGSRTPVSIQVPLLVIDRRHVSVMSTLFSNP